MRPFVSKYSPNPWSINASHPKKAGKSGDSNLTLHTFREYLRLSGILSVNSLRIYRQIQAERSSS